MKKNVSLWFYIKPTIRLPLKELLTKFLIILLCISNALTLSAKNGIINLSTGDEFQQKQVTGTVTDRSGSPFPGVNVVVTGTNIGTTTDISGKYTISVPPGSSSLTFTFVGMDPQTVTIGESARINVTMTESAIGLEEVIVIGYGTVKKSDLTGAISSVSSAELSSIQTSSVLGQAQGKLAGVDIIESNGTPGSSQTIRIRGNRSITAGNDPLFVVDGIPTSQEINDFNPGDIESMEVLKDASAVAIYGSRGANGVILITTKHGGKGKARISFDTYYGLKNQIADFDHMNSQQFVEYKRVANSLSKTDNSQDQVILGVLYDNYINGVETNYLDEIYRNGTQKEYQLSASGGDDKLSYYLSGSYYDEKGLIKKTDYNRYSLRANLDATLTKKLKVGLSLTTSKDLRNSMTDPTENALRYVPLTKAYNDEGEVIAYPNPDEALISSPLVNFAPNQYVDENKGFRMFSNMYGEYEILPDLKYRLNFGIDMLYSRRGRFEGDYAGDTPTGSVNNSNVFNYTIENILSYNKTIGDHNFNLVGLFSSQFNSTESSSLSAKGIPITRSTFYDLGSAETITGISSQLTEWGLLSYMGRINYKFKDRYLITASGRADGSSRLAEGNKWAFFPAASIAWIITKENFMQSVPVLSFLKLRVGYGSVGNTAISPYQTQGGLTRSDYVFADNAAFGYQLNGIANPELGWEISGTLNVGLDFGLWKDRISGTMEVYDTKTNDLLLQRLLPTTSGFTSVIENIGATRNRGFELTLSANVLSASSGLKWDVEMNLFSNKEEIVQLFNGYTDDIGNEWFIGEPINSFYDNVFDGIWQTDEATEAALVGQAPGQIKIRDVNGRDAEGVLTKQPDGLINSDDRSVLGSTNPKWTGGLTNKVTFKGFDFSMLLYARQGQMLNTSFYSLSGNNWEGRRAALNFNYWTPNNPSNEFPQPVQGKQIIYASSLNYFDGSFMKIKNISLGYDFAKSLIRTDAVSAFRVYFSATNPVIWSPFKLTDPETGSALSAATYFVGINLKF
jgi:TonB-linked SusC/RagA family outer membrane protein